MDSLTCSNIESWRAFHRYVLPETLPVLSRIHHRGLARLNLNANHPPDLNRLRELVFNETGWELVRAYGEVPAEDFFAMLSARRFPLVNELRGLDCVFASAQPDLWHEVFGHIPALWDERISEMYMSLGRAAKAAADRGDGAEFTRIGKLYWYIFEYGVLLEEGNLRLLGAGLVASPLGPFALKNPHVRRLEFDTDRIAKEDWNPYKFQDRMYVMEGYPVLF